MKRIILVSIGFLLLAGCRSKHGSGGNMTGTIHYQGKPVNGAVLHFYPLSEQDKNVAPGGERIEVPIHVQQDGTFEGFSIAPGDYKIVVEPFAPPKGMGMPELPKDPAKRAEMEKLLQGKQGEEKPTIPFPDKYKNIATTDLKCTIKAGKQTLPLELK